MSKSNYDLWQIDHGLYPKDGSESEKVRFILQYGELAPSTHNTQPWIVELLNDGKVKISPDKNKFLEQADPSGMWQFFAIGMFVENVIQAGLYFGKQVNYRVDGEVTYLDFSGCDAKNDLPQIKSLTDRASNKKPYKNQPVSREAHTYLENYQVPENIELRYIPKSSVFDEVLQLHMSSAEKTAKNEEFVKEVSGWMRPNWTKSTDGMPGFIVGAPGILSALLPKILKRKPQIFQKRIGNEKVLLENSSALVIFGAKTTNPTDMIEAGIYSEKLWLGIIKLGMVGHPMTASMHDSDSYTKIQNKLGMNYRPVYMMRIGYSSTETILHSPRKAPL